LVTERGDLLGLGHVVSVYSCQQNY